MTDPDKNPLTLEHLFRNNQEWADVKLSYLTVVDTSIMDAFKH